MGHARYDAVADTYGINEDVVATPTARSLFALVGIVRGQRVLDLACGHGPIAREMARRGADVTAIDLSSRMISRALAAELAEPLGVSYLVGDAAAPSTLTGQRFDAIVCHFGMSDIDDLEGACANVRRLLTVGGRFVFAILHPCFPGVADVSSSWPTTGSYFDEGWWRADGTRSVLRREVGAHHRTLGRYVNMLHRCGLWLDAIDEPRADATWAATRPGVADLPLYLVVRCVERQTPSH